MTPEAVNRPIAVSKGFMKADENESIAAVEYKRAVESLSAFSELTTPVLSVTASESPDTLVAPANRGSHHRPDCGPCPAPFSRESSRLRAVPAVYCDQAHWIEHSGPTFAYRVSQNRRRDHVEAPRITATDDSVAWTDAPRSPATTFTVKE